MEDSGLLKKESQLQIDHWMSKYPVNQRRSAIVAAIKIVQKQNGGHITPELQQSIANYVDVAVMDVKELVSFYDMCETQPVGRHKIGVCTNVSCQLSGSDAIVARLEQRLSIRMGETTPDGLFTLRETECLAACVGAPMCQVNDEAYHENLTPALVDELLDRLSVDKGGNDGE